MELFTCSPQVSKVHLLIGLMKQAAGVTFETLNLADGSVCLGVPTPIPTPTPIQTATPTVSPTPSPSPTPTAPEFPLFTVSLLLKFNAGGCWFVGLPQKTQSPNNL